MDLLTNRRCVPCEGGVKPLDRDGFAPYLEQVSSWTVLDDRKIERSYAFRDFAEALAFANEVGRIAEDEGHHPDIYLYSWNKLRLTLWTHAIGGLSVNDFIMARRIDQITPR